MRHLDTMQRVVGTITAKEKQKLTNTDGRTVQQKEVYYPVVTYSLDGLSYEWVGTSSAYPKWNVGETVMLYFDKQTGKVWEKKDGFRMLRKGISGMVCSAVLTAMFWLVLFSKEL